MPSCWTGWAWSGEPGAPLQLASAGGILPGVVTLLLAIGCAPPDYQWVLEDAVSDWGFPGATAVVREGGQVVFSGAAGVSDLTRATPMDVQDRFRLGSLTKPFTAVLVHQLDQEGLLALSDTIDTWVDGVPNGERITVAHLLGHTSGLGDYVSHPLYLPKGEAAWAVDDLLALAFEEVKGEPGERGYYSNAGYMLLGRVIEGVTGQSWEDAVQVRIAGPLGLEDTGPFEQGRTPVRGYERVAGELVDATENHHSENGWASGALVSSTVDLSLFADALWSGQLLDDAHLDLLLVINPATGQPGWYRSLGLRLDLVEGEVTVGHMGESEGYRSDWSTRAGRDATIVTMHNGSWRRARDITDRLWHEHGAAP